MRIIRALIILLLPCFLRAESQSERRDMVLLEEGQVYQGDYFAAGSSVEISGTVNGDAYIAAGQVTIDGVIMGDLLILCGGAEISGDVKGNIRVLGGQVNVTGTVQRNATLITGNLQLSPASFIQGNTVIVAGNADSLGRIAGNAKILASNVKFSSRVAGDVKAYAGEIRVTSKSFIGGSLEYRSNEPAWIDERAQIKGSVIFQPSLLHNLVDWPWLRGLIIGSKILALAMNFLFAMAVGWVLVRLFPSKLGRTLDVMDRKPVSCLGSGVVAVVLAPLLALILLMTVLGAPFALALIALNILGFYTAKIFFILWVASKGLRKWQIKRSKLATLALGLVAYYLVTALPFIGTSISILAVLLGVGAMVLAQTDKHVFVQPEAHK